MKSLIKVFIVFVLIAVSMSNAFSAVVLKGSGTIITEERKVSLFNSVKMNCMGYVVIKEGTPGKVIITSDDNLMPSISVVVDKGVLVISLTKLVKEATKLQIEITMEGINELSVNGSGKIELQKKITADNLKLFVSGAGNIIADIEVKYVYLNIVGSGSIDLYGKTVKSEIDISGSSSYNGLNLACEDAIIAVGGTALCRVSASKTMDINLLGGKVEYKGTAKIKLKATLTGSLECLD